MSCDKFQPGEVAQLGREIYLKDIKPHMKKEDIGMFVAIDVINGHYEVTRDLAEALVRLRDLHPGAHVTAQRVGYKTPFSFGARRPDDL